MRRSRICPLALAAAVVTIHLLASLEANAAESAPSTNPPGQAGEREIVAHDCPPDGSRVAIFTRQGFDEGRQGENREYGRFVAQIFSIAASRETDEAIVEKSIMALINFAKQTRARGHDLGIGDVIIHEEAELSLQSRVELRPIYKACNELLLSVIREMKRVICRR
jgi:hypothetical protein